jgi:amino acid adenylation domain-containing protein
MTVGHCQYSLINEVAARAFDRPEAVALVLPNGQEISYGEMYSTVLELAGRLTDHGVRPADHVAVVSSCDETSVFGLLAVASVGAAYVPIDVAQPQARLRRMLDIAGVQTMITRDEGTASTRADAVRPTPPPLTKHHEDNAAYLIFTSGSTGDPKPVVVSRRALFEHVRAACDLFDLDESAVSLQFASPGFDVAQEEIWCTLVAGGSLVLRGDRVWPLAELVTLIDRHRITHCQLPTAYWTHLVSEMDEWLAGEVPSTLRVVIIGSEPADRTIAQRYLDSAFGSIRLINAYGPTEAVITATAWDSRRRDPVGDGPHLPIGRTLPGRVAHVLDEGMRPVPVGTTGELYLSGTCIANGYATGSPDTKRTFTRLADGTPAVRTGDMVRADGDGVLHFVGRQDNQVKVAGVRIELGEVDAALRDHRDIAGAVVTVAGQANTAHLVAHVVPRVTDAVALTEEDVRQHLLQRLPRNMVPRVIRFCERLPVTVNGKLDRRALS